MFARSSSWAGSREALQDWEDHVDEVASMIRGLPGVAGAMFFLDRSGRERVIFQLEQLTPEALSHDVRKLLD